MVLPSPAAASSLLVGDLDAVRLRATRSPQLSVMMAAAVRPARPSPPPTSIRSNARAGWSALSMKGLDRYPDSVTPIGSLDSAVTVEAERLRQLSGDPVAEEIRQLWGATPPGPWLYAAEHPRAWLHSLANACLDVWSTITPRWSRAITVLDREISRIGIAAVTGTTDALLNSLHRQLRYHDGVLDFISGYSEKQVSLAGRQLVLIPLLTDWRLCVSFDQPGLAYIAYPALGQRSAGPRTSDEDPLRLILGPVRARALRGLDVPRSMRQLAARMQCGASNATYHCDQLEAAGLITRDRRGQSVWAARTGRGDELIELFGPKQSPSLRFA